MFFLTLLLLILIITFFFTYSNLNQKIINQKKQLTFLVRNNDELKDKLLKQDISQRNFNKSFSSQGVEIKFETPSFNSANTVVDCILYAAPFDNSPIICEVSKNTSLEVQDTALLPPNTWYEVNIPVEQRINSKGWVKADVFKN